MTSTLPGLQSVSSESVTLPGSNPPLNLEVLNQKFDRIEAIELIEWSAQTFGQRLVMSTSFGIQSAVMLKLVTSVVPDITVIWVDTGYLPPETYRFAEQLSQRLSLNLKVYQSPMSPARMEALYGRLWEENSVEALNRYDQIRKVEPMDRALAELGAAAWLTGLRAGQTDHRKTLNRLESQGFGFDQAGASSRQTCYKLMPILHWSSKDVYDYLMAHELPYHPLWEQGYVSVGDWHSSRPLTADDVDERSTRFNGLKQECGIHIPQTPEEAESLNSSSL
ncbi:MAG: phosphoadenylyl-sulfate reductase [Phormidesmis sp.]